MKGVWCDGPNCEKKVAGLVPELEEVKKWWSLKEPDKPTRYFCCAGCLREWILENTDAIVKFKCG